MREAIRPFKIDTSEEDLNDLKQRLQATRWPDAETVAPAITVPVLERTYPEMVPVGGKVPS